MKHTKTEYIMNFKNKKAVPKALKSEGIKGWKDGDIMQFAAIITDRQPLTDKEIKEVLMAWGKNPEETMNRIPVGSFTVLVEVEDGRMIKDKDMNDVIPDFKSVIAVHTA